MLILNSEYRWMRLRHGVLRAKKQMREGYSEDQLGFLTARYGESLLTNAYMRCVVRRKEKMLTDRFVNATEALLKVVLDTPKDDR